MNVPKRVGRYDVELALGEGEEWRVLVSRDAVLGRQVAVRVLRSDLPPADRERLAERVPAEARAAATLSHPALVPIHDMGDDPEVGPYLVFELVHGPPLRERLQTGEPLAPSEVAFIARGIGSALSTAHGAGIVHGAVRPENILLPPTGPRLADMGVARSHALRPSAAYPRPYAAPETLAAGTVTPQSEEFSFAATLYEALTGRPAFPGDDAPRVATQIASAKHAAPTAVVPALRRFSHLDVIFDRALAKEPRTRFATCEGFAQALAAELEGESAGLSAMPGSLSSIVPRATRRWQNIVALTAVAVIVGLVVAGRSSPPAGSGVSLRSVASAFASVASGARGIPPEARRPPGNHTASTPSAAAAPSLSPSAVPPPTNLR